MKSRTTPVSALVALALLLPAAAAGGPALLYPPDLLFSPAGKVKLFGWNPGPGGADNVVINGVPSNPWEGETFLKGEIPLVPGMNTLEASGRTVRVYHLPGARMESFRLPSGKGGEELVFQAQRIHPALDDGCESCHAVTGGKLAAKDQKEACYACHNDFSKAEGGKKAYLHPPVAAGECTGCHDPHFSATPKLQKLSKGCYECHDPFPQTGSVHRPVAEGECTACHSPHVGSAPKMLLRPGNALCIGCHENTHERHRSAEVRGRMTTVPDEFPKEKGDLSCTGCHSPHHSGSSKLLRGSQQELCKTCHRL